MRRTGPMRIVFADFPVNGPSRKLNAFAIGCFRHNLEAKMTQVKESEPQQELLSEEFAADTAANILDFTSTLKELRKTVGPELVRHREAWRDRSGNVRTVEYVEWHTVADILDSVAPNWAHSVKDIRTIGDYVIVTVAITIDGVTREGIGTGSARSETGIKKAEHDALKRAAVKFGIARDLYKKEFDAIENRIGGQTRNEQQDPPFEAVARTFSELITTRQISMIRAIAREAGVDADAECSRMFGCSITDLTRRAASRLIDRLNSLNGQKVSTRTAS